MVVLAKEQSNQPVLKKNTKKNRRTEFKIIAMGAGTDKVDVINNSTNSFDKKTKK